MVTLLNTSFTFAAIITLLSLYILLKRRLTRKALSGGICNLPTVMWLPKFFNYYPVRDDYHHHHDDNKNREQRNDSTKFDYNEISNKRNTNNKTKMASSSITNILPRMERLNGPYGIYATVYGISTKVIHVAHPIPAKIILMGDNKSTSTIGTSSSSSKDNNKRMKNQMSVADSLGAVKTPAYDHFLNMFGNAVFTADGSIWKSKRSSVIHCLLKGCMKDDSKESQRLVTEANLAADTFLKSALKADSNKQEVNIVKLLQRSTIGLIYRFLTHHDFSPMKESDGDEDENAKEEHGHTLKSSKAKDEKLCTLPKTNKQSTSQSCDDSTTSTSSLSSHDGESTLPTQAYTKNDNFLSIASSSSTNEEKNNPHSILSSYLEAITKIRMIILAQSRSIWFLLPRWLYRLFSPMYREEEKQMKIIRHFARTACLNAQPGSPLHLLRSRKSHNDTLNKNIIDGQEVNKHLLDEAITLLFAGQDTSAATLSWTLHLLSLNPKVQSRLAKEVREAIDHCDDDISDAPIKAESYKTICKKTVMNLPYLDAVIKESMRLYPVAPFVVRKLPEELSIPMNHDNDDDYSSPTNLDEITIPKDTLACIWIYSLHRNKNLWHKPDDFVPERWIDPNLQKMDIGQRNGSFMPFAAGPRNCVGQPLARIVLRIVLARILYFSKVHDPRMDNISDMGLTDDEFRDATICFRKDMQAGFTVLPTGGVWLNVDKRNDI